MQDCNFKFQEVSETRPSYELPSIHIPLEIFRLAHYKTPMAQSGVLIGIALLAVVSVVAFLIGRQAARGVEQFREEHHERFKGSESR